MAGAKSLKLSFGLSNRFLLLQIVFAALGVAAILSSPASWAWKSIFLPVLILSAIAVHVAATRPWKFGIISLHPDGTGHISSPGWREGSITVGANAWVTRWLCVLTVFEQGRDRQYHCIICASENDAIHYRQLVGYLRMRVASETIHKAGRSW